MSLAWQVTEDINNEGHCLRELTNSLFLATKRLISPSNPVDRSAGGIQQAAGPVCPFCFPCKLLLPTFG